MAQLGASSTMATNAAFAQGRQGQFWHPQRGTLSTYFFEARTNRRHFFDERAGVWTRMPVAWECHQSEIQKKLMAIQDVLPQWTSSTEMVMALRENNYDVQSTIIWKTEEIVAEEDYPHDVKTNKVAPKGKADKGDSNDKGESVRVTELTDTVRAQEAEIARLKKDLEDRDKDLEGMKTQLRAVNNGLQRQATLLGTRTMTFAVPLAEASPRHSSHTPTVARATRTSGDSKESLIAAAKSVQPTIASLKEAQGLLRSEVEGLFGSFTLAVAQAAMAVESLKGQAARLAADLQQARALYRTEVLQRKLLFNQVQELRGNIRVFCRVRKDDRDKPCLQVPSRVELLCPDDQGRPREFDFDRVFDSSATQEEVFEDTAPLLTSACDGYNVCILAYGQTGAGKTHTMMGSAADPGVNPRTMRELFRVARERKEVEFEFSMSVVEVYNETIVDLLAPAPADGEAVATCTVLNNPQGPMGSRVANLTMERIEEEGDLLSVLQRGEANRKIGSTRMNSSSSRSHLVVTVYLNGKNRISNNVIRSKLTLVDLAGSERVAKTDAKGDRLIEAAAINKSLSALGQVFTALRTQALHVPYRNSKLTYLLQDCLGGDAKAMIFVNVSPLPSNRPETQSTLLFGRALRQVRTNAVPGGPPSK